MLALEHCLARFCGIYAPDCYELTIREALLAIMAAQDREKHSEQLSAFVGSWIMASQGAQVAPSDLFPSAFGITPESEDAEFRRTLDAFNQRRADGDQ